MISYLLKCILLLSISLPVLSKGKLNHVETLRRASFLLVGQPPSDQDLNDVSELSKEEFKKVLEKKIDSYMNSSRFSEKMRQRLNELFQLKVRLRDVNNLFHPQYAEADEEKYENSLDYLFLDIVENNKTWDKLLTEHTYKVSSNPEGGFEDRSKVDDVLYFSNSLINSQKEIELLQEWIKTNKVKGTIQADSEEEKKLVAGSLTTSRFNNRFGTTKLNKNLSRAAAFFRIFLCDNMNVVDLDEDNDSEKNLGKNESRNKSKGNNQVNSGIAFKRHASDPACQSCHYKLDPVSENWYGSSQVLNKKPNSAGLVYTNSDGILVNIKVNSFSEFAKVTTEQKDYQSCQVQHFWNWFVGSDVLLSQAKKKELTSQFNKNYRRPKDFIKYLILSEDFSKSPELKVNEVNYSHIKHLLVRCDSCHRGEISAPNLVYGFEGNQENSDFLGYNISQILWSTNLKGTEKSPYMPPKRAGWSLQNHEKTLLKAWIKGGAKNSEGVSNLNQPLKDEFFSQVKVSDADLKFLPTFENTYYRFIKGYEFMAVLKKYFPGINISQLYDCDFRKPFNKYKKVIGFYDPKTGKPTFRSHSPQYASLILNCVESAMKSDMISVNRVFEQVRFKNKLNLQASSLWSKVDHHNKLKIIQSMIGHFIGEGVRTSKKGLGSNEVLNAIKFYDQKENKTTKEVFKFIILRIFISESFLTI